MMRISKLVRTLSLIQRRRISVRGYNNLPSAIEPIGRNISALENVHEDLSEVVPHFPKSFNLAAYVNNSEVLQSLVHLHVNLSKIEKKPHIAEKILKLDMEQNIKKHVLFIKDYVDADQIGEFITKNPMILCEPLEDLEVRINYLKSKRFSSSQIQRIVSKNPFWLMFSTTAALRAVKMNDHTQKLLGAVILKLCASWSNVSSACTSVSSTIRIDKRLGYYQQHFDLSGMDIRLLATKQPKLITYNIHQIKTNTFVIKEEMGFEHNEVKQLILAKPKLWMIDQRALLETFNYIHNVIKISHTSILQYPGILLCRKFKVKQRHLFLDKLGRAQFDPKKENYVPIIALVENTDTEFCTKYAKCNVNDFNLFLKTL